MFSGVCMKITLAIDEYLACKENRLTHDTYQFYLWGLEHFERWCTDHKLTDLAQITPVHIQQFIAANPKDSENTRHHKAQVAKGFLRWCAADKKTGVKKLTIERIEMPKVEQPDVTIYTEEEINKLLAVCTETRFPLRNRAILLLLLDTGVRASELVFDSARPEEKTGLLLENVVIGKRGTESYVIVPGKGRKPRTIKFGETTRLALSAYLERERPRVDAGHVFLAQGREALTVHGLEMLLVNLAKRARIKSEVYPHKFRHTFAIRQLQAGVSSLVLMQLLGHSTLESTKIYTRALTEMQSRAIAVSVVDEMHVVHRRHRASGRRIRQSKKEQSRG